MSSRRLTGDERAAKILQKEERGRQKAIEGAARQAKKDSKIESQQSLLRHELPDPDVLRPQLARRRAVFPPRGQAEGARERERAFAALSASYREQTPIDASDVMVEVEDVALCAPDRYADKLKIPYSMIQRVREVVVGGIMIDIGANIGQTSVPRILLGDFSIIYAAEADPLNYARLRATIEANRTQGFVRPDRPAIGSTNGTLRFVKGHYRSQRAASADDDNVMDVPCVTLDSWIDTLQIDVDAITLVKVDTNGFEHEVLRGAPRLLAKGLAVWQLEVAPEFLRALGSGREALCAEIERHFTHFIDLGGKVTGPRVRQTTELMDALAYLSTAEVSRGGKPPQTDLLCMNA